MIKTKAISAQRFAFSLFPAKDRAHAVDQDWAARFAFGALALYGLAVLVEIATTYIFSA
jgi:hypothetical protein